MNSVEAKAGWMSFVCGIWAFGLESTDEVALAACGLGQMQTRALCLF